MVVWFDEDGNPVCNVDLAKYGLAMPEIDLPQKVKDEIRRRSSGSAGLPPCRQEMQGGSLALPAPPCSSPSSPSAAQRRHGFIPAIILR
ncbi:MAG: hypothetical protein FWG50_10700 [Kiritimatiellaeota bacterium]|nr:hypothetical protein [Kiritimatiellota bacterium]